MFDSRLQPYYSGLDRVCAKKDKSQGDDDHKWTENTYIIAYITLRLFQWSKKQG